MKDIEVGYKYYANGRAKYYSKNNNRYAFIHSWYRFSGLQLFCTKINGRNYGIKIVFNPKY